MQKTGVPLVLPISPDLHAAIDAMPKGMTFLTLNGPAFKPGDFSQWFARQCRDAGIPRGYAAHGLRKAACRRLAEAGCSTSVIAAITGHKTLRAVEPYVRAADQARMARMGMEKVAAAFGHELETSPVNLALPVSKKG
ncbi:MAG TPA: tyrosine-type recombinase/integrase [Methyloceanibacter sp.]|nr:tyrosine-type recombinase/integrase [Methyloceanibacter sp.]